VLDEWVSRWSSDAEGEPTPAAKKTARRPPVKNAPAKKAPAKKSAAKKAPARKAPAKKSASADAIGSNPARRYGSGGSRALSR
jgi:polyhydroxyalkanoate synthase